jgi:hypothetical protein
MIGRYTLLEVTTFGLLIKTDKVVYSGNFDYIHSTRLSD